MLFVSAILTIIGILVMMPFVVCVGIIIYGFFLWAPCFIIFGFLMMFDIMFKPWVLIHDAMKWALHRIPKTFVIAMIGAVPLVIGLALSNGQSFEVLQGWFAK